MNHQNKDSHYYSEIGPISQLPIPQGEFDAGVGGAVGGAVGDNFRIPLPRKQDTVA